MGRPTPALRLAVLAGILVLVTLVPAPPAETAGTTAPFCNLEQAEPVPANFDGCAELERQVMSTSSFNGPDGFRLDAYEKVLAAFFGKYCHRNAAAGWVRDKQVRDTGPYAAVLEPNGTWSAPSYFGTHLPVVIWYNPEMIGWLRTNRPAVGAAPNPLAPIPDGAMMVKEMFPAPAARCASVPPERLTVPGSTGVAFMVRDSKASQDGWFWGAWWQGFTPDWPAGSGNGITAMGFAPYCLNCHASAADNATFADLKNVQGEPGEPNVYLSQNFLFENQVAPPSELGRHRKAIDTTDDPPRQQEPRTSYLPAFLLRFPTADPPTAASINSLPSQTYDHTWVPGGVVGVSSQFLTSTQCIGCHDAGGTGLQYDMTEPSPRFGKLLNFSPYGTWRTSPMGLGGRDPIFLAQLASETETFHPDQANLIQDVCFGCHGIQGQRQLAIDRFEESGDCGQFERSVIDAIPYPADAAKNPTVGMAHYGSLARDGISCTSCHRMALTTAEIDKVRKAPQNHCVEKRQELLNPQNTGFARTFTGSFFVGAPDELAGPFPEPKLKPMEHALGNRPMHSMAIKNSEVCGSCHTVHLPIFQGAKLLGYTYEQTTYPEWAMSAYRTGDTADGTRLPAGAGARAESCQGCHMRSASTATGKFRSKIASIQELSNFPATENTLPGEDIDLSVREGFARHTLVGLNVFFVEMAQQFPNVLGIPTQDPMMVSRGLDPILLTEQAMLEQAANETATVEVLDVRRDAKVLSARVQVHNKVGHKFPSGVGFRRAFLSFEVLDARQNVLWASGRTDEAGTIVDQNGQAIVGEFLWTPDCSTRLPGQPHQPHYQVVRGQDQAQIYQELTTAPAPVPDPRCGPRPVPGGQITTSFLSICGQLKDNRLLPHGFLDKPTRVAIAKAFGAGPELAEEAGSHGVGGDPDYDRGGGDSLRYEVDLTSLGGEPVYLRATLYYQATPPSYLQDRFCTSQSPDTERLYFLAGHLDLDQSPAQSWKLAVTGTGLIEVGR